MLECLTCDSHIEGPQDYDYYKITFISNIHRRSIRNESTSGLNTNGPYCRYKTRSL